MRQKANKWVVVLTVVIGLLVQLKSQGWKPLRQLVGNTTEADVQLANAAAQDIAEWLPLTDDRPTVAVARVVGDRDGLLSESLEGWIGQRNVNLIRSPWYLDLGYLLGLIQEPQDETVARLHRSAKQAKYMVAANVTNWTSFPEHEQCLVAEVQVVSISTGQTVAATKVRIPAEAEGGFSIFGPDVTEESPVTAVPGSPAVELPDDTVPALMHARYPVQSSPAKMSDVINSTFWGRFIGWVIVVLLMPIVFHGSLVSTLRRQSNSSNLLVVVLFLSTSLPLGWWLWAAELAYPQGVAFALGAFGGGVLYFGRSLKSIMDETVG